MAGVVTGVGGGAWNSGNYSFTDGVLSVNAAVADGSSGAGAVTINSLGTVFVNGNGGDNRYWAVDSTRINAGGVLLGHGHSHLHNLTLAGGELAGIRPSGQWGGWDFDDATTVTGGTISTISAQQVNLSNGTFNVDAGSTLNFTGSVRAGALTKNGAGALLLRGRLSNDGLTINGGTVTATRGTLGGGNIVVNNGGVLLANDQWVFSGPNPYNENPGSRASLTVNAGGEFRLDPTAGFANGVVNLVLNGGSVTGGNGSDPRGALYLVNGNEQITAGGNATSTIASVLRVNGNNNPITVSGGSTLEVTAGIFDGGGGGWSQDRGGLVKSGSGVLRLSGGNGYTGQTDIAAGTLVAANNTALGAGGHDGNTMSFVRDGATLALQGGVSLDEHLHVWGTGVGGLGAVRSLSGDNALTNAPSGGPGYTLRSNVAVGVDAGTLTVSGFYEDQGSWGLTKVGAGRLVLTQENTYTGGTIVDAGVLSVAGSAGRGRLRGALTVNAAGTVEVTGDGSGLGYQDQISSVTINGGSLTSANTQHIWNIAGGITMTGGTLQSNNGVSTTSGDQLEWNRTSVSTLASATSAVIGGRIRLRNDNGYSGISFDVADGAAATDLLVSAAVTEAAGGMGVTKNGPGTMALAGENSYTGPTVVNGGTVMLRDADWVTGNPWGGGGATGPITVGSSGTLSLPAGVTQLKNGLTLNGGTLSSRGLTFATEWRNIVLSSDVTAGGAAVSTITSAMNLDGNRTFTVGAGSTLNATGELAGWYSNGGGVTKEGVGTLVLASQNSYGGATAINAGTLVVQAASASSGFATSSGARLEWNVASGALDSATTSFTGTGTIRKTGGGELRWGSGAATFAMGTGSLIDVQAGTFVGGSNANENWASNKSDLNVVAGASFSTVEANVRVNRITGDGTIMTGYTGGGYQNLTIGVDNGSSSFTGTMADAVTRGNVVKAGSGTITLAGNNTYSGVTDITAGMLVAATNTALGPGGHDGNTMSWIRDGATLALQGGVSLNEHFHVWGAGVGGLGAVRSLSGNNALTNAPSGGAGYALRTNVTVGVDADTLTVSGFYEDQGNWGLTKIGAGRLALTAVNTYTGATTVDAGTLDVNGGSGGTGLIRGAVTVNPGATLAITGGDGTGFGWNNPISSLTVNGGTVDAAGSSHIGFGGSTTVAMSGGGVITGSWQWNGDSRLSFSSSGNTTNTISGALNLRTDNGANHTFSVADGAAATDLLVSANLTDSYPDPNAWWLAPAELTKTGPGTMVVSGSNSYNGRTTISGGTLVANSATALGDGGEIVFAGGMLRYTATSANQPWATRMKNSTAAAIALDTNGQYATLAGVIDDSNTAGLTKAGAGWLSLAGTNTYTGPTTVSAGTLAVNGSLGATAVSVATDAILSGWGSIAGPVSVGAGGILAPGNSPGTLTITNTLALANTSIIDFEINAEDTTVGSGINDLITGVTNLTLGGTLNLAGGGDFTAVTPGTRWRLFDYSGTLTDNTLTIGSAPTLNSGLSFNVDTATANQVNLVVVPEPGSLLLAGLGLAAAGWAASRRQR
jgi:autotransporter-associated beta strand protein